MSPLGTFAIIRPMSARTLILFDVDGTLIRPCGLGRKSLDDAFASLFGVAGAFDGIRFHGRMDPDIFADGLDRAELDRAIHYPPALEAYLAGLASEVEEHESLVLDGILTLLDALSARPGEVRMGLVTGNVEAGARLKLSRDELWPRFTTGAFGGDADTRAGLIGLATERAMESFERVVYVGDTEYDVEAARGAGVRAVAVATGGLSHEDLARTEPDVLLENWNDTDRALEGLLS